MMTDAEYQAYIAGLKEGDTVYVYTNDWPWDAEPHVVGKVFEHRLVVTMRAIYRTGRYAGQDQANGPRIIIPPDEVAPIQSAHAEWRRQHDMRRRLRGLGLPGTTREKVAEAVASMRAQADLIEVEAATLTDEEWEILAER